MTLIQTGKADRFPVILIGRSYWKGLDDWMRKRMLQGPYRMIDHDDRDLFHVTDSLAEAIRIIEESRAPTEQARLTAAAGVVERRPSGEGTVIGKPSRMYRRGDGRKRKK